MSLKSLKGWQNIVIFDTETSGLDAATNQIIELAAIHVVSGEVTETMDEFIRLPEGVSLDNKIIDLTGITDEILSEKGIEPEKAAAQILQMINDMPSEVPCDTNRETLMVAHNAQFDAGFLACLLRGKKVNPVDWLDTLTVFKDRRAYPHKLCNAIATYGLEDKVQNSHRAIDDTLALLEVLKALDDERPDLNRYVNLFGVNPRYGRNGRKIRGVTYMEQPYYDGMQKPDDILPEKKRRLFELENTFKNVNEK